MSRLGSGVAIRAADLGKHFQIGVSGDRRTVLETLRRWTTGALPQKTLWALRGISFELGQGEILGVIGPNGAGKSTLLLVLAEILAPSEGTLEVYGKTDPLFKLSAGLQPRLTVLENFSLCSALLGVPRPVFLKRLPEMIAFTGLEDHLYARYGALSSGQAARLPFAVAIHADLDIILADEMLAVGDKAFQSKCLETFADFKERGKTLVIVSHNMEIIRSLCSRTLYLDGGRPRFLGDTEEAIRVYEAGLARAEAAPPTR